MSNLISTPMGADSWENKK